MKRGVHKPGCGCVVCSPRAIVPPENRFWKYVDRSGPLCWEWTAAQDYLGYGRFNDENGRKMLPYRWLYEVARGPIPQGMFLCHHCDNPRCVNPDHLFVGTALDNRRDCVQKGRAFHGPRGTHCPHGHEYSPGSWVIGYIAGRPSRRCLQCRALGVVRHNASKRARYAMRRSA